ncbi:hypothetical protein OIO90_004339 [Microbotryomycetes sp. JL221]|nr:hypothetical protein OIO90_004339 [Microbotryomycetes sp. JL221]
MEDARTLRDQGQHSLRRQVLEATIGAEHCQNLLQAYASVYENTQRRSEEDIAHYRNMLLMFIDRALTSVNDADYTEISIQIEAKRADQPERCALALYRVMEHMKQKPHRRQYDSSRIMPTPVRERQTASSSAHMDEPVIAASEFDTGPRVSISRKDGIAALYTLCGFDVLEGDFKLETHTDKRSQTTVIDAPGKVHLLNMLWLLDETQKCFGFPSDSQDHAQLDAFMRCKKSWTAQPSLASLTPMNAQGKRNFLDLATQGFPTDDRDNRKFLVNVLKGFSNSSRISNKVFPGQKQSLQLMPLPQTSALVYLAVYAAGYFIEAAIGVLHAPVNKDTEMRELPEHLYDSIAPLSLIDDSLWPGLVKDIGFFGKFQKLSGAHKSVALLALHTYIISFGHVGKVAAELERKLRNTYNWSQYECVSRLKSHTSAASSTHFPFAEHNLSQGIRLTERQAARHGVKTSAGMPSGGLCITPRILRASETLHLLLFGLHHLAGMRSKEVLIVQEILDKLSSAKRMREWVAVLNDAGAQHEGGALSLQADILLGTLGQSEYTTLLTSNSRFRDTLSSQDAQVYASIVQQFIDHAMRRMPSVSITEIENKIGPRRSEEPERCALALYKVLQYWKLRGGSSRNSSTLTDLANLDNARSSSTPSTSTQRSQARPTQSGTGPAIVTRLSAPELANTSLQPVVPNISKERGLHAIKTLCTFNVHRDDFKLDLDQRALALLGLVHIAVTADVARASQRLGTLR